VATYTIKRSRRDSAEFDSACSAESMFAIGRAVRSSRPQDDHVQQPQSRPTILPEPSHRARQNPRSGPVTEFSAPTGWRVGWASEAAARVTGGLTDMFRRRAVSEVDRTVVHRTARPRRTRLRVR
jgi:hypothetical protein